VAAGRLPRGRHLLCHLRFRGHGLAHARATALRRLLLCRLLRAPSQAAHACPGLLRDGDRDTLAVCAGREQQSDRHGPHLLVRAALHRRRLQYHLRRPTLHLLGHDCVRCATSVVRAAAPLSRTRLRSRRAPAATGSTATPSSTAGRSASRSSSTSSSPHSSSPSTRAACSPPPPTPPQSMPRLQRRHRRGGRWASSQRSPAPPSLAPRTPPVRTPHTPPHSTRRRAPFLLRCTCLREHRDPTAPRGPCGCKD
jgi:hypothetical protein